MIPDIYRFKSNIEFIRSSTEFILNEALIAVKGKNYFTLMLSGGLTPKNIYNMLSLSPYKEKFPWDKSYFFLTDERVLSCKDPYSNIYMLRKNLFDLVLVDEKNLILPEIVINSSVESAKKYEVKIEEFFKNKEMFIDLTLLGIGKDGHTASLFPGDFNKWNCSDKLVLSTSKPYGEPLTNRISVGLKLLNRSKTVLLLAYGKEKGEIINEIQEDINNKTNKFSSPIVEIKPKVTYKWYIS